MLSNTLRLDTDDHAMVCPVLEKFCLSHSGKYFLSLETADITKKLHLQGWVTYKDTNSNNFKKAMSNAFKDILPGGKKAFKQCRSLEGQVSYIVLNDHKGLVPYEKGFTNYTRDEFTSLIKDLPHHVEKQHFKPAKQNRSSMLECFMKEGMDGDLIRYPILPQLFIKNCPSRVNQYTMRDQLIGLTIQLENKFPHPDNRQVSKQLYKDFAKLEGMQDYFGMQKELNNLFL